MKKLAVIVPCYNEELVIGESYRRTRDALQLRIGSCYLIQQLTGSIPASIIYIYNLSCDRERL